MPYSEKEKLPSIISSALNEESIKNGLLDARISKDEITKTLNERDDEVWSVVKNEITKYNNNEILLNNLQNNHKHLLNRTVKWSQDPYYRFILPIGILIVILFFFVYYGFSAFGQFIVNYLPIFVATKSSLLTIGIGSFILSNLIILLGFNFPYVLYFIKTKKWLTANKEIVKEYYSLVNEQISLSKKIQQNVLEKSIYDIIRGEINRKLKPSFSRSLDGIEIEGLGEVIDISKTIDTESKNKLHFFLENMPGGSIGISGARGSGKSTLIRSYCGDEPIVSEIKGKKILSIFTTAPVRYDYREFILHLFTITCENLLNKKGEPINGSESIGGKNPVSPALLKNVIKFLRIFTLPIGFIMFFLTFILWTTRNISEQTRLKKQLENYEEALKNNIKDSSFHLENASKISFNEEKNRSINSILNSIKSVSSKIQNKENFSTYYLSSITKNEYLPVKTFTIGLISLIIWLLISIYYIPVPIIKIFDLFNLRRRRDDNALENYIRQIERDSLTAKAKNHLNRIKFQQSIAYGWSGNLKFPSTYEETIQHSITNQERAMSNPEIISEYSSFLKLISEEYQVIIGIDEMDKMESETDATNFLNELKSLFVLQRCFFLISVSENAMQNFERRGLPFRDVFDSSFDSIIHLGYFKVKDTISLLEKRVIGRPFPFFYLTHCLSGGLPRDVIRTFRELVRLGGNIDFNKIIEEYVSNEVRSKLYILVSILKKTNANPKNKQIILQILDEYIENISIQKLHELLNKFD
ncbi:hypothetical protein, partial [Sphingobacterium sp. MYb388]|uniref:hypothetical protein n=1 Tax=Sphingobacterium sp. MYb388 TaxID=2745437 RepID=UPI0030ACB520